MMTEAEIRGSIAAYHEHGDMAARDRVVVEALRSCDPTVGAIQRSRFASFDVDDMRQMAAMIVMEAIDSFKPGATGFNGYALNAIRRKLPAMAHRSSHPVEMTRRNVDFCTKFFREWAGRVEDRRPSGMGDVLDAMGAKGVVRGRYIFLVMMADASRRIGSTHPENPFLTLGGWLAGSAVPADVAAERKEQWERIARRLDTLPATQRDVVRRRYGLGCDPLSYREIGEAMGISYQYAQQLHAAALTKLRMAG